jgi:uncharacterized protein YeaO (DUF488 family)
MWPLFNRHYLAEIKQQTERIAEMACRIAADETVTLLCSSACSDANYCHRTLLKGLIEKLLAKA